MLPLQALHVAGLEAPRLRLRRLTEADGPALVKEADNWNIARYTALIPHPYTPVEAAKFIDGALVDQGRNTRHVFAIETRIEARLIGCIEVNMGQGGDTFGYWIGEDYWGQGYATEASLALVRFAFQTAGKREVCASVHPDNPASAQVVKKAGFVFDRVATDLPGRCAGVQAQVYVLKAEDWFKREAAKPKLLVSAVALIDTDGRVLVAKRPIGKPLAGLWEFPGGKVHDDETPEAALVRELQEELGIKISQRCLTPLTFASHAYEAFHLIMPLYLCRNWVGQVTGQEGQDLQWIMPNRLNTLPMPPADMPLVAMLMDVL